MQIVGRVIVMLACAAALLAGAGIAAYELTLSAWWSLGATTGVGLILGLIVDEVLGIGVFFGERKAMRELAEREEEEEETPVRFTKDMPKGLQMAIMDELRKRGLTPTSMHKVGDDDEDDEHEEEIIERMKTVAETLMDPDMKEFAFHFTHIATDCPGSVAHAARLVEVAAHIEARLRASTQAPLNDDDRPTMH